MNTNKALWEKGDFTRIAASMRESGEELIAGLGITHGMKVLDLGCGDGTTALPAARLGADVLGGGRHREQPRRSREQARAGRGPEELPIPGRRCHTPKRTRRSQLRPRYQYLRSDVRAET